MSDGKVERAESVSDEVIVRAWQRIAKKRDADGNPTGSVQEVADNIGMKRGSLTQRVASLRKRGLPLAKMPRKGKAKKDIVSLQALLSDINADLEADELYEAEATDDYSDVE